MGDGEREMLLEIQADISEIKITLARQSVLLEEHIRRTALAELAIAAQAKELSPIKIHVAMWGYLGKILATIATIGGLVVTLLKLFGK